MAGRAAASAGFEELGPGGQLGLEPVEGLAAELRLRRVVGRRLVLALPGGGQGGGAGGVVAVPGLAVVAELRVACQRLGPEPGGGGEALAVVGTSGRRSGARRCRRAVLAPEHGRKPVGQGQPSARPRRPTAPRGIASPACSGAQLVPLAVHLPAPRRSRPAVSRSSAEVAVGLGVVGLEPDRLAVFGDGLVELPLVARALPRL